MSLAMALHVLFAVIWVGGMIFAMVVMRPVVGGQLEASQQGPFMTAILERFFKLVWAAVIIVPATGFWTVMSVYGGFKGLGAHVHLMTAVGLVMVAIFVFIYFALYRPFKAAVAAKKPQVAGPKMAKMRLLIWTNLVLGVLVVLVATAGKYS
ncbi:MAG: CopD family protein [Bdellovibrionaceae bacterium]|nr:CopD family protein [Bdellovibrionales bacterium]MCB9085596.1 CopD family protein [Pseudobdellovibrionaceae bacterium]